MAKITNTVILHDEHVEIIVENFNYKHIVLLDVDVFTRLKSKIRVSNCGYVYTCNTPSVNLAHFAMNHTSNMETVVDHVNGATLDNRCSNLRVVTQQQNSQNKSSFIRNNTGVIGIAYRKNGKYEYYRVSLTDRSKGLSSNRQGQKITKQFNINKLGKQEAFIQAKAYLAQMKLKLNYLI